MPQRKSNPPSNVYLSFYGVGFSSGVQQGFDVLCGANPPKITDGYAKWNVLDRPMERGLTILQGYDPAQMVVEIIFGLFDPSQGWQTDDPSGMQVEQDIGWLEWMGGSNFQGGPSPAMYVYSYAVAGTVAGGQSNLIPPQYRNMPWIVASNGLQWGQAWRNPNGFRVYQEATITLQNYLNLNAPPKADLNSKGGYFISKAGRDSALLIAGSPSALSPTVDHQTLAKRILGASQNNPCKGTSIRLQRRAITWQIRHGVHVWVPAHQIA